MRRLCLSFPDAEEGIAWGHPVFRVSGRIFCGYERIKGTWTVGFRVQSLNAEFRERDPALVTAQNFGRHRWLSVDAARVNDWESLRSDIADSYRLVAPRRSLAKLAMDPRPAVQRASPRSTRG